MITAVDSVDLRVDDLEQAIAFYRDVVGLEEDPANPGHLREPGGTVLLRLRSDGVTGPSPRRATGLFHTAFRFPTRGDRAHEQGRRQPVPQGEVVLRQVAAGHRAG